jgi:hypothetical protein
MHKPLMFSKLKDAIEESHRWVRDADLPALVTLEEDGLYTLYGHGKRVYNTTNHMVYGTDLDVYCTKDD